MRIAHVTDCYLPQLGGIEMHVHDLAARQRAQGHDVVVLTRAPGPPDPRGVPVVRFAGALGLPSPRSAATLTRLVAGGGYDVVHSHSSLVSPLAWSATRAAVAAGVPAVLTMHSVASSSGLGLRVLRPLGDRARGQVRWTAVSATAAAPLRRALGEGNVSVLPNGIDPQWWRPRSPAAGPRPLTLVSVMRVSQRKRPLALLRVLAEVRRRLPPGRPLRAVVVGSGPKAAALARAVHRAGMSGWVELPGRLDRRAIRRLFEQSDVYLAPATLESFGIAALEARCAGLPVIAMACGGVGDFVRDGVEGFLVGSDAEMAGTTARLLSSPDLLRSMQEHNRRTTPAMDWESVVEQNLAAYRAAGGPAGPPGRVSAASTSVPAPTVDLETTS